MEKYSLNNNIKIPKIGFGTYLINGQDCINAIENALNVGYRHIDTAARYKNEQEIGQAIRKSNVKREEIFITSKVWKDYMGYDKTIESFNNSLQNLGMNYIDLFLIHWPNNQDKKINIETWKALEELYIEGKIKTIGTCNFLEHHLIPILENCKIKPMVNQIEYHPGLIRSETIKLCKENNILIEAWSPLGKGELIEKEELKAISRKYNKSVAQVCIRWCLQNGVLPLPKSSNIERMKQNIDVFNFEIQEEDMQYINGLKNIIDLDMNPNDA